uniref:Uncharacterized protein n=1 Tax=Anguilla anguilla TaxID=7936 RepID=A0A0E9R589_ANGAN
MRCSVHTISLIYFSRITWLANYLPNNYTSLVS